MRTSLSLAGAVLALFIGGIANAGEYTVFVYETPAEYALRTDPGEAGKAYWAEFAAFADILAKSGAMRDGAPLTAPSDGLRLSAAGVAPPQVGKDGLLLSGWFKIEAADRDAAQALAAQLPAIRRGGAAELRASFPAPAMTPR